MSTYRLLSLLLLGLLVLPVAPLAVAAEELPDAQEVARWILSGDELDLRTAVRALDGAPTSYLAEVVVALRKHGKGTTIPDEPPAVSVPAAPRQVMIDLEVWRVPQGTLLNLFGPNDSPSATPMVVQFLEAKELAALREKLIALEGVEGNQGVSLIVTDGKEADLAATEEVEVQGNTHHEGLTMTVRPHVSADRRYLTLEMEINHLTVRRPVGSTAPVVAEHPSRTTLRIPDRAALVLSGFRDDGPPHRERIAILKAVVVGESEADVGIDLTTPEQGQTFIQVEAMVLEVAAARLAAALGSRIPDEHDNWRLLDAKEFLGLLGTTREGAEGVTVLHAPHLTTYDGQTANISILNQTSYVRDFEVEKKDGRTALDPIVDTIQDGLVLEVTPTIAADRKGIDLQVLVTLADLFRPIAEFQTKVEGQKVTIQIPELRVTRSRATCDVPPGRYVLIGGLGKGEEGRRFVLIRTALITPDALTPR